VGPDSPLLDALASHDAARFYRVIVLAVVANLGVALLVLFIQLPFAIFLLRWRQWLTKKFLHEYLQNENYYYFLNRDRVIDNPDERLSIDISLFVNYPASVATALVSCLSNFIVFGYVLWSFAWYLVLACALFYFFYSIVSLNITRPIMNLEYVQRKLDGDFRFALVKVRVNAEPIAFLGGESVEEKELSRRLDLLIDKFYPLGLVDGRFDDLAGGFGGLWQTASGAAHRSSGIERQADHQRLFADPGCVVAAWVRLWILRDRGFDLCVWRRRYRAGSCPAAALSPETRAGRRYQWHPTDRLGPYRGEELYAHDAGWCPDARPRSRFRAYGGRSPDDYRCKWRGQEFAVAGACGIVDARFGAALSAAA